MRSGIRRRSARLQARKRATGVVRGSGRAAPKVLEEYLPYSRSAPCRCRELLLHEGANDQAWWWRDGRPAVAGDQGRGGELSLFVSSTVPSLARAGLGTISIGPGIWSVLAAMVLAAFTWVIVRFIETHICLVGVDQPLWSKARLAGSSGDNLYVVCDPSDRKALADGTFELRLEPSVRIVDARPGPDATRCGTSIGKTRAVRCCWPISTSTSTIRS